MAKRELPHDPGRGIRKAAAFYPERVTEALREFRQLNTREARAAFADHWIGLWARDFDDAWPMLYELLKIVKEDELFRDPRRVGPGAAGGPDTHGSVAEYPDFKAYFEDRVSRPFDTWAELEKTYRVVSEYRPDLLGGSLAQAMQAARSLANDIPARAQAEEMADKASQPGRRTDLFDNVKEVAPPPTGNSRDRALRKLRKDAPELHARVVARELSPHAAMVEAGYRPKTATVRVDSPERVAEALRRLMGPEELARLIALLLGADQPH